MNEGTLAVRNLSLMQEGAVGHSGGDSLPRIAQTPKRGRGRPPGSKNKPKLPDIDPLVAEIEDTGVRGVIYEAFRQLGGIAGLVEWGQSNKASFYRLFAQCGPRFSPQPAGRRVREKQPGNVSVTDFTSGDGEA